MNPLARQFADLRFALQELESAVQQPRGESHSEERVLNQFPNVIARFVQVLTEALTHAGHEPQDLQEIFTQAHARGWLKGEKVLWLHLVAEYEHLGEILPDSARALSLAQHIRACSSMLWQTYELLTQRFRWQTQIMPAPSSRPGPSGENVTALRTA